MLCFEAPNEKRKKILKANLGKEEAKAKDEKVIDSAGWMCSDASPS